MALPDALQGVVRHLAGQHFVPGVELQAMIDRHVVRTEQAWTDDVTVDFTGCLAVANTLRDLLAASGDLSGDHRALVQAAVVYFAAADDAEGDHHSPDGFVDDAAVTRWVAEEVGLARVVPAEVAARADGHARG